MAKKAAAKSIVEGSVLKFKGYAEAQPDGLFKPGDFLRVVGVTDPEDGEDPSFTVARFVPKDGQADPKEDAFAGYSGETELAYIDEVSIADEDEAEDAYIDDPAGEINHQSPYTAPVKGTKTKDKTETKSKNTSTMKTKAKTEKPAAKKGALKTPAKSAKPVAAKKGAKVKATKTKKEATPKKEVLPPVVIHDSKAVTAALRGKSALEAIHAVEKQQKLSDWTLGGLLSKVKREGLFAKAVKGVTYDNDDKGFESFLLEQTSTGVRKAYELVRIYDHFSPLLGKSVDEDTLASVPWPKAKLLVGVCDTEEATEEWLEKAVDLTTEALAAEVRTARVDAGTTPKARGRNAGSDSMTSLRFKFFNDQAKVVLRALALAKKKVEGDEPSDSAALHHIIVEWLADHA